MATADNIVRYTDVAAPQDDQSWLINRMTDGVREVQLDLSLFTGDATKEQTYFASITDNDVNAWMKSGIPLARVTASGKYGPYDPKATDGRQTKVAGFLESQLHVVFTRTGFENQYPVAGLRYMGVIDTSKLPVTLAANTSMEGLFLSYEKSSATSEVKVLAPKAAA